jgi:hypothetical protein
MSKQVTPYTAFHALNYVFDVKTGATYAIRCGYILASYDDDDFWHVLGTDLTFDQNEYEDDELGERLSHDLVKIDVAKHLNEILRVQELLRMDLDENIARIKSLAEQNEGS